MDHLAAIEAHLHAPEEKDSVDRAFDAIVNKVPQDTVSTHDSVDSDEVSAKKVAYDFEDPLELAQLLFESVRFHKWQSDTAYDLARAKPTQHKPFRMCLTACNGSGKDAFVIAPFVVWFMLTRIDALVVVTSSSGVQLTAQTETYIARMCELFNAKMAELTGEKRKIFKVIKRHIVCLDTGSVCRLFATDEAGKAEGYHPLAPGAEMAIIVNEAKSVAEEIFEALSRCTGYNFWLEISTPGEPVGHFYKSNTRAADLGYKLRRVTSYECPHKDSNEIELDKIRYGERSALFRSKHLALFTQLEGQFIVGQDQVNRCRERCKSHIGTTWKRRVGIDVALSNGGDETNVYITLGNKLVSKLTLHTDNISMMADDIHNFLLAEGIPQSSNLIYLDDGGVGRALWPLLQERGWTGIQRVLNQFPAFNKAEFANRGTELWFNLARMIEECVVLLPEDVIFDEQLTSRKYTRSKTNGKIIVQSKRDMKAEGVRSPDRVDAFVLSLHGLTVEDFHEELRKGNSTPVVPSTQAARALTSKELLSKPPQRTQRRMRAQQIGEPMDLNAMIAENKPTPTFMSVLTNLIQHARHN